MQLRIPTFSSSLGRGVPPTMNRGASRGRTPFSSLWAATSSEHEVVSPPASAEVLRRSSQQPPGAALSRLAETSQTPHIPIRKRSAAAKSLHGRKSTSASLTEGSTSASTATTQIGQDAS
eukprot:Filipodium_phascolosomae@DN5662_c0_g1_i1.p1